MQSDADHEPGQPQQPLDDLPEPDRIVVPREAGLHHHVPGVVGPPLDERDRREQQRLAQLAPDAPLVQAVEVVARIGLVGGHGPERGEVQVAQVLFPAFGRPGGIGVGQVVVARQGLRLERPRGPDAGLGPAQETGGRGDDDRPVVGQGDEGVALDERHQVGELVAHRLHEGAGLGVPRPDLTPDVGRLGPGVDARRDLAETALLADELPLRDREQRLRPQADALPVAQPAVEPLPTQTERRPAPGGQGAAQVVVVAVDGLGRLGGGVGEVAEQVQVLEPPERPGQVALDELDHPVEHLRPGLDEDARRVLHVGGGRLEEARGLPQLGHHAPRPLLDRGVVEEGLAGERGGQQLGVVAGVALPRPDLLELVEPAADVVGEHAPLELLLGRQAAGGDAVEAPREPPELAPLGVDGGARHVLETVVVRVHPVAARGGGSVLVEKLQILVYEVRERFRSVHGCRREVLRGRTRTAGLTRSAGLMPADGGPLNVTISPVSA